MTYDGRPLWEETFAPSFDEVSGKHDIILAHRFVFVQADYSLKYTGEEGMIYGVTLEADGVTASSVPNRLMSNNNASFYKGSNLEQAVRIAGTKRVEMASVGKRGDYIKSNAQGQGVVTLDPAEALAQLKEDAAIGSRALIMFNGMSGARSAPVATP